MSVERRRILFSGYVQGVGFRMTAIHLSGDLPLAGTVRNTADGDVELIVEGDSQNIDELIRRLREQFASMLRTVQQQSTPASAAPPAGGIRIIH
jgi:acylphosphatase